MTDHIADVEPESAKPCAGGKATIQRRFGIGRWPFERPKRVGRAVGAAEQQIVIAVGLDQDQLA